jgi:hypothetical protein
MIIPIVYNCIGDLLLLVLKGWLFHALEITCKDWFILSLCEEQKDEYHQVGVVDHNLPDDKTAGSKNEVQLEIRPSTIVQYVDCV